MAAVAALRSPLSGTKTGPGPQGGVISSAHPLATRAGLQVLKDGGNAFDAAVAVASVLNVVEPMNSGIGGYGTILIYDAEKGRVRFLDSSGKIPSGVDSDAFRPPTPDYSKNRRGAKAVSTPGNVNAWWALSSTYGRLAWADLFAEAVRLSEEGFIVDEDLSRVIGRAFPEMSRETRAFYGRENNPLFPGDRLVQEDLGRSFRRIAKDGPKAVYGGELGKAIHQAMKDGGGFLSLTDLKEDKAEWWEPISIDYRGYRVYTASPPSTAFPSLIRLGLMSRFDVGKLGHNSPAFLHRFAEVTKHAFWCRLAYAGDPEINPPPLDRLLSPSYWEKIAASLNMEKASVFVPPDISDYEGKQTTHFVVADGFGNIVSATQTLGNSFGSRMMAPGTGIWLNNSLAYCTFEPKGNPMDAHAGHRKLSGDCPTIIFRDGKPWVALGTPGGHTIGQTVPQMVMNLIDFGMGLEEALAAPRISFGEPDRIAVEFGIASETVEALQKMGHSIQVVGGLGNAHALLMEYDSKGKIQRFVGAADPRGKGLALTLFFGEEGPARLAYE